ncbi:hypothetical protein MPSEU_000102000 [Mayamaea pseudoterrestris]|nr:hypothetical protein MPSEU_000102000 [Mayamaea pseudoterrestris]
MSFILLRSRWLLTVVAACCLILSQIAIRTSSSTQRNYRYIPTDAEIVLEEVAHHQGQRRESQHLLNGRIDSNFIFNDDAHCPFRDSTIYRKVFVYPNLGDAHWMGDILSDYGHAMSNQLPSPTVWPWLYYDVQARANTTSHYDVNGQHVQYTTELLVRELLTNPNSCLRTYDPEQATLFYVPYLPSMEFHQASKTALDYSTSMYGQAILDIVQEGNHSAWERYFGLTSKYWRRRNGSDHILVFSEPFHGLLHTRNKRGHYHYIRTQQQTAAPIVISVELSTSFVNEYPECARKNILMPYPNTDGRIFNGLFQREATAMSNIIQQNLTASHHIGTESHLHLPEMSETRMNSNRPASIFYSGGNHGTCTSVRRNLEKEVYHCSKSFQVYHKHMTRRPHHGMWLSTFCPTPGGDSPSAKRMFDAVIMGCIPVVMSHDFVWPFSTEFDIREDLNPLGFSVRLNAADFETKLVNYKTCQPINKSRPAGILDQLKQLPEAEVKRWQVGLAKAADLYSWYKRDDRLVQNPLQASVLPTGGAAHRLVRELELRAGGVRWPACQREYAANPWTKNSNKKFKC